MISKTSPINLVVLFASAMACSASAEGYKNPSAFSTDYRCTTETIGGFGHGASGSEMTRFTGRPEFFLTHISNIPDSAMMEGHSAGLDELKARFEGTKFKKRVYEGLDGIWESGSYFLRESDQDPKKMLTYLVGAECEAYGIKGSANSAAKLQSISCWERNKSFELDLETMKFSYSYLGTGHRKVEKGYYGDSSILAFGRCEKYFR